MKKTIPKNDGMKEFSIGKVQIFSGRLLYQIVEASDFPRRQRLAVLGFRKISS
jgi:hypothetical protein